MAEKVHRGGKKNRKHGRQARSLSHARYWAERRLEKHKVRNLVRCNGMTEHEAYVYWISVRTKRIKTR